MDFTAMAWIFMNFVFWTCTMSFVVSCDAWPTCDNENTPFKCNPRVPHPCQLLDDYFKKATYCVSSNANPFWGWHRWKNEMNQWAMWVNSMEQILWERHHFWHTLSLQEWIIYLLLQTNMILHKINTPILIIEESRWRISYLFWRCNWL
jgi:hypothetical protein